MTRLLTLLAALAPVASAQEGLAALIPAIGSSWDALAAAVPPPDSGAVADGTGTLRWTAPEAEVALLYAVVERGTLRGVEVTAPPGGEPERRLESMLLQFKSALGPPADPPFFTAQQIFEVDRSTWLDVRIDPARRRIAFRQPADPPPAVAPPPPRSAVPPPPPPTPARIK